MVRIIIFGGSGHWAEQNHYPAILKLKSQGVDVRVTAICDPTDPYNTRESDFHEGRANLGKILALDKPVWIDPSDDVDLQIIETMRATNVAIIAANPVYHMRYAEIALKTDNHILCDKPILVRQDSSWDLLQAQGIIKDFNKLTDLVRYKRHSKNLLFSVPLRRRNLPAFKEIIDDLRDVYKLHGQHITHLNAIVNGGIHRYPSEFLKGGAHGYLDGVGSLSHSCYHYIDFIAWLISSTPAGLDAASISISNIKRVSDYLRQAEYTSLAKINNHKVSLYKELTASILNAELDFHVDIKLYKDNAQVGQLYLTINHTSFSPRTIDTSSAPDHANQAGGGRMSQLILDVHQGALQSWQLIKNDAVFHGNNIVVTHRTHPGLGPVDYEVRKYADAYARDADNSINQVVNFVKCATGLDREKIISQDIEEQVFTMRLFAAMYESIAASFTGRDNKILLDLR